MASIMPASCPASLGYIVKSPATQPNERITTIAEVGDVPLHIALVEPEIPPNTGNVARLCAATGCALHLIEPLGFKIDDRELKRAGLDYWPNVRLAVHSSLDAFLEATASLSRWFVSTHGRMNYGEAPFARGDVLVFGKETRGLPAELLERYHDRALRIPMRDESVRSLNLSTSVGIVTYAALQHLGFPDLT
jgi:tRNA (cytidine/uridine-2'-O-)-methyltransferase